MEDVYDGMGYLGVALSAEEQAIVQIADSVSKASSAAFLALRQAKQVSTFPAKHTAVLQQAVDNLRAIRKSMSNALNYLALKQRVDAKEWKLVRRATPKMPSLGQEILTEEEFIEGKGIM